MTTRLRDVLLALMPAGTISAQQSHLRHRETLGHQGAVGPQPVAVGMPVAFPGDPVLVAHPGQRGDDGDVGERGRS
ncbi:hypothetical protein [Actinoplanes sp. OR16]|uniref:hypothetical protein n=1 Tax=Actinoplanes sp. OR16 TaxID=946334 RepID=UPI000FD9478B|nr:hypothetical protein [Actinoplanes sp. OR16]